MNKVLNQTNKSEFTILNSIKNVKKGRSILGLLLIILFFSNFIIGQNISSEIETFKNSIAEETNSNYGKAIEIMEKIYKENKDEYLINYRLGWLKYQIKQYSESIKYYNIAAKISDNSVEVLLAITYPLAELKKWDELLDTYSSILDKDEMNYAAIKQLGIIYFNRKNYLKSKGYFEDLITNYPSDYYANVYLGWNYYNLGSKAKAEEYFSTVLLFYPDDKSAKDGLKLTR